jgi:hypothetical protein
VRPPQQFQVCMDRNMILCEVSAPGSYTFYWIPDVQNKIQNSEQEYTMNIKDSRKRVAFTQSTRAKESWHFRVTMFKINWTHSQTNSFLTIRISSKSLSLTAHFLNNASNFVSRNFVIRVHEYVIRKFIKGHI